MSFAENIREKNKKYLNAIGVACPENLPLVSEDVEVKNVNDISNRAFVALNTMSVAHYFNYRGRNEEKTIKSYMKEIKKAGTEKCLLPLEKKVFDDTADEDEMAIISWNRERVYALYWALGKVETLEFPYDLQDYDGVVNVVYSHKNFKEFCKSCSLRSKEEILEKLDLYRIFDALCKDSALNGHTEVGDLYPEIVEERLKALEWLVSENEDWYNLD